MSTAQPLAWRGDPKKEKYFFFQAKAVLDAKYGGNKFFGQNLSKAEGGQTGAGAFITNLVKSMPNLALPTTGL